jgi:hypothetical protein
MAILRFRRHREKVLPQDVFGEAAQDVPRELFAANAHGVGFIFECLRNGIWCQVVLLGDGDRGVDVKLRRIGIKKAKWFSIRTVFNDLVIFSRELMANLRVRIR